MARGYRRRIFRPEPAIQGAAGEIHILKPYRIKGFVHTAQGVPDVATNHKESSRWLFDGARLLQVAIKIAVSPVNGIRFPQAVNPQQLKDQSRRRGQAPDGEAGLGT